jgi:hypothetical protein
MTPKETCCDRLRRAVLRTRGDPDRQTELIAQHVLVCEGAARAHLALLRAVQEEVAWYTRLLEHRN